MATPAVATPAPSNPRLFAAESRLQLLQQSHAMVLESIAASERAQHRAVLDEFDAQEAELKAEIAELKTKQQQREATKQGQRFVVGQKKE